MEMGLLLVLSFLAFVQNSEESMEFRDFAKNLNSFDAISRKLN